MAADKKRKIFEHLRNNLLAAGLSTSGEASLICPLCWGENTYDQFSIEHVIPSSVGGRTVTLSCEHCNNTHGSELDSHITKYQQLADAFQGVGTIPAKMQTFGQEVTANIRWSTPESGKHITVVGKASNPNASDAIQAELRKGNLDDLKLTLNFGYIKTRFQTALLRSAYLILFRIFGYRYTKNEVVQLVRRHIIEPSLNTPDTGTLVSKVEKNSVIVDKDYYVIHGFMEGIPFFQVIIRLKRATESYLSVMMPVPHRDADTFFDVVAKFARENQSFTFTNIPRHAIFTEAEQTDANA